MVLLIFFFTLLEAVALIQFNTARILNINLIFVSAVVIFLLCLLILNIRSLNIAIPSLKQVLIYSLFFAMSSFVYFYQGEFFTLSRDEGIYTNSAYYLASHGSFKSNDSELISSYYGFSYNSITGEFEGQVIGYTIWLALFIKLFGVSGIPLGNSLLFFFVLYVFFEIGKSLRGEKFGLLFVLLMFVTYGQVWLFKRTLSESLSQLLIWFVLLVLIRFKDYKNKIYLFLGLPSLYNLFYVRLDTYLFPLSFVLSLIFLTVSSKKRSWRFLLITGFSILALSAGAYFYIQHYNASVFSYIKLIFQSFIDIFREGPDFFGKNISEFMLVRFYNIYPVSLILLSLFFMFKTLRLDKNIALMLLYFLPGLYVLMNPGVSPDLPWFIRRFMPIIVPFITLISLLVIFELKQKVAGRLSILILAMLFASQIIVSYPGFILAEGRGMYSQIREISSRFEDNDLIWVTSDRIDSKNYYEGGIHNIAPTLYFTFNKRAIIDNKIKLTRAYLSSLASDNNLYILSLTPEKIPAKQSQKDKLFKSAELEPQIKYDLAYNLIVNTCDVVRYIAETEQGKKRFDYDYIKGTCYGKLPTDQYLHQFPIEIYRLKKQF